MPLFTNHLLLLLSLSFLSFFGINARLNVADFGAVADGKTYASQAFLASWAAGCASPVPITIHVPRKKYLLGPVVFQGPCNNSGITFELDGILAAPRDYRDMSNSDNWIMFYNVEGVSFIGGFINGQGSSLWACKNASQECPIGASSLAFYSAKNILVQNLTSINSQLFHIVIHTSDNVKVQGVTIHAPAESPNTDGIHVQESTDVIIVNSSIKTGDDCISIGPGARNLRIQQIACGPGHGVSIGSLANSFNEEGVQNVTVKNVVFTGTQNGLRIKSWARPSKGFVEGVVFQDAIMVNVQNPIVIDQNYCPEHNSCPNQESGVKINTVTYRNIRGTSATKVAVKFNCSATAPCKRIGLQNIRLKYLDQEPAESFCKNVQGTAHGLVVPLSCL